MPVTECFLNFFISLVITVLNSEANCISVCFAILSIKLISLPYKFRMFNVIELRKHFVFRQKNLCASVVASHTYTVETIATKIVLIQA